MALSNISDNDIFYTAVLVRQNQIIDIINKLTDYNLTSLGTITLTNPGKFQSNVTLNVASGLIKGDGGLITNVRSTSLSSIPNSALQNNSISINSQNNSLVVVNSPVILGNTITLRVLTSPRLNDLSNSNIASANAINTVYSFAQSINTFTYSLNTNITQIATISINSYDNSNATSNIAIAAFEKANSGISNTTTTLNGEITVNGAIFKGNTSFGGTVDTASANVKNQILIDNTTISWNLAAGQIATVTLGGTRTMSAPTNMKIGTYILHVIQDGVGNRDINWNAVYKWSAGVKAPLTSTGGARDIIMFVCDGTNMYGSYIIDVK